MYFCGGSLSKFKEHLTITRTTAERHTATLPAAPNVELALRTVGVTMPNPDNCPVCSDLIKESQDTDTDLHGRCPGCGKPPPSIIEEMFKAVNSNIKFVDVTPTDNRHNQ